MSAISKRIEKIELAAARNDTEPPDLQIAFVEVVNGRPGRTTRGYTLAVLVELPAGHEHEWHPYEDGESA